MKFSSDFHLKDCFKQVRPERAGSTRNPGCERQWQDDFATDLGGATASACGRSLPTTPWLGSRWWLVCWEDSLPLSCLFKRLTPVYRVFTKPGGVLTNDQSCCWGKLKC